MVIDEYKDWHAKTLGELTYVAELLSTPLPSDPHELLEVLSTCESWYARVGYWLSEANSFLERFQYFHLSDKEGFTETERKVKLASDTSEYRKVRNQIEVLLDSLKQRIILGESMIRFESQFQIKSPVAQ